MSERRVYLDHAATTPLRSEARAAMLDALDRGALNPSSPHAEGRAARALLDDCRDRVAGLLGASRKEIVFTAGGTEADNLAVLGIVRARRGTHAVAAATEHHAVLEALQGLRDEGCRTTLLGVDSDGRVDPAALAAALRDGAALTAIMYANNEIGTVAAVDELARLAHAHGAAFHCDAVQAPEWLPLDVAALGVDSLAMSAHKFGGPKGTGALYVRNGTPLAPVLRGGGQEFGRRPGTEDVVGIVGLTVALEAAVAERSTQARRVAVLRDRLERELLARLPGVRVNGGAAPRLPNIGNLAFEGIAAAELVAALDLAGVATAAGSACTSGVPEPSHVVAALGLEPRWRDGAIRLSLGRSTPDADIDVAVAAIVRTVEALRGNTRSEAGRAQTRGG